MGIVKDLGIFPKRNVRVTTYPASLQKLADFAGTLAYLLEIIPMRKLPSHNNRPIPIEYSTLEPFRQLCYEVCKELANNNESGVSKIHIDQYLICQKGIRDCITLFEENKDIMDFDMTNILMPDPEAPVPIEDDEFVWYVRERKKNWYRIVYDTLVAYAPSFDRLLSQLPEQNVQKFLKSKAEQAANGSIGGKSKGEKMYQEFASWVKRQNFNIAEYQNVSNENFVTALLDKGFKKLSPKTAGRYKKIYLSELDQIGK